MGSWFIRAAVNNPSGTPQRRLACMLVFACMILSACSPGSAPGAGSTAISSTAKILEVTLSRSEVPRYELVELDVSLEAAYQNPYDARQVRLEGLFTGPDGQTWTVPGFWDARERWLVRFAPPQEGEWRYAVRVTDGSGASRPVEGTFAAAASPHHGPVQVASRVDPSFSPRYLAYGDGKPFYGIGQCEAFTILSGGFDAEKGVALFDTMRSYGANMVVYWPFYSNPFFNTSYDSYSYPDLKVIDLVVQDAERKGITLVFTVWAHPQLRAEGHPWGDPEWEMSNGFRKLGDVHSFFTSEEAWAWQENLYRYIIARWGYSQAIGMWQTVSEIEGTSAGLRKDAWHKQVNEYFAQNDPFRHPTSASMAGDQWWPAGYAVMDIPQVHVYAMKNDPAGTGRLIADWTQRMWDAQEKPNFVGEYGSSDERNYPEMAHNALWAALAAGAAATPMEWNDSSQWGTMTSAMYEDLARLAKFLEDLPLAQINPDRLEIRTSSRQLLAYGIGGRDAAVVWVQDASQAGQAIDAVRANKMVVSGAEVTVRGLAPGSYRLRMYNTWTGEYSPERPIDASGDAVTISLDDFTYDIALRLERTDG